MELDTANKTVSLARNLLAFANDFKALVSSSVREKQRYLSLIASSSEEHHDRFSDIAKTYFAIISTLRNDLNETNEPSQALSSLNKMMVGRDALLMDRSSLRGASQGLIRILQFDAPESTKAIISQYRDYVACTTSFFFATEEDQITSTSWCSDLFDLAYYAFKEDSADGELDPFSYGEIEKLKSGQLLSENDDLLGAAREAVMSEITKCQKLLEERMIACNDKYSALRTSLVSLQ